MEEMTLEDLGFKSISCGNIAVVYGASNHPTYKDLSIYFSKVVKGYGVSEEKAQNNKVKSISMDFGIHKAITSKREELYGKLRDFSKAIRFYDLLFEKIDLSKYAGLESYGYRANGLSKYAGIRIFFDVKNSKYTLYMDSTKKKDLEDILIPIEVHDAISNEIRFIQQMNRIKQKQEKS